MENVFVNIILYVSYFLLGISLLAVIVLPLINAIGDPKSLVKVGGGVLAIVVLFFIGYAISGNEVTEVYAKFNVGPELSKIVGGSLTLMYMLFVIAIIGIVYTEISKFLK